MNYRILEPQEFEKLSFILEPRNLPLPNPTIERVGIAEDDGKIVGMSILRLLPMWDGLWIEPAYRGGKVDYNQMEAIVTEPLKAFPGSRCYTLITGKFTSRIAENAGYKPLEWRIFEKEF